MNNNSTNFELPGNNFGIEVPTIERPINSEHLAAIRNYKVQVINNPAATIGLTESLDICYEFAFLEFTHTRGLDSRLDAILEAIRLNNQEVNARFDRMDTRMDTRFDGIDSRLDGIKTTLDNVGMAVNSIVPALFLRWPMDFSIPRNELPLTRYDLNALQVSELDRILLAWDLPVNGNMESKRFTIYNRVKSDI